MYVALVSWSLQSLLLSARNVLDETASDHPDTRAFFVRSMPFKLWIDRYWYWISKGYVTSLPGTLSSLSCLPSWVFKFESITAVLAKAHPFNQHYSFISLAHHQQHSAWPKYCCNVISNTESRNNCLGVLEFPTAPLKRRPFHPHLPQTIVKGFLICFWF